MPEDKAVRLAVLGDTHGSIDNALEAVRMLEPVNAVVHLGDFDRDAMELERKLKKTVYSVRGDNDPGDGAKELVIDLNGYKIFATHGHYYDIEESLEKLIHEAKARDAHAVFFGHDHKPRVLKKSGLILVNPGTLFLAEKNKTLALVSLDREKIDAGIIKFK